MGDRMERQDLNAIVELVTRQVMSALEEQGGPPPARTDGLAKVLVVGKTGAEVPDSLRRDAVLFGIEDYRANRNILRYDRVVISHLDLTQLADIAQGRIGDEVSCAVLHALLNGIETLILEDALSFRKYAGRGSAALYQLLEGYARTLEVFGVRPVDQAPRQVRPEARPPEYRALAARVPVENAAANGDRLITEARATALVKQGTPIRLPARAIITPAARDVFAQAGVALEQGG